MKTEIRPAQGGIPKGGTSTHVLTKNSNTDYDVVWGTGGGGGGGITSINGDTTPDQVLSDAAGGYIDIVDVGSGSHTFAIDITGLTSDSTFQTNVNNFVSGGGSSGTKLYADTTQVVVGSGATTAVKTVPIPGGVLGTNNVIRFNIPVSAWTMSSGSGNVLVSLTYGATQIAQLTMNIEAGQIVPSPHGHIEGYIYANASANAQKGELIMQLGDSDDSTDFLGINLINDGTSSENSALNKNLIITVQTPTGGTFTVEGIVVESISGSGTGGGGQLSYALPTNASDGNPCNNYYADRDAFIFYDGTGFILQVNASPAINWSRNLSSDWGSMAADIPSVILQGTNIYALIRDSGNDYRVYQYDATNSATAGTLCTFSVALGTQAGVTMTTDGTYYYFTYQGGNSTSDNIISKYSLSGTTFTHVSDTTMTGGTGYFTSSILAATSGNIYGFDSGAVKQFTNSGSIVATTQNVAASQVVSNLANVFYSQTTSDFVWTYTKMFVNI